ncbi:MAG: hypothetical protein IJ467_00145 [Bacteroidaceae bacterium]|nr:hypothetical protein [Bacteroidaceae bacterium]
MKKFMIAAMALMLCGTAATYAQTAEEKREQRKEIAKMTRDEVTKKVTKEARKEAKRLKREDWEVAPGALPMEKQLDRSFAMQYEVDDDGYPKYLMSEAMSIGENYDAAKVQAIALAKQNLAGNVQTEVSGLIDNMVSNKQLTAGEAASLTETTMASKALISQNIGRTITVTEMYRDLSNNKKEVLVRIAYSNDLAIEAAKKAIRQGMQDKGDALLGKLEELLNKLGEK